MTNSDVEVEWHQSSKMLPSGVTVLLGMARNPNTKKRIGPVWMAALGTPQSTAYPPDLAWLPIKGTGFSIEVESGPVVGILKQEGQQLDRWEDLDLSKPWFWAPPENSEPVPSEPYVWRPAGWTEIGATIED